MNTNSVECDSAINLFQGFANQLVFLGKVWLSEDVWLVRMFCCWGCLVVEDVWLVRMFDEKTYDVLMKPFLKVWTPSILLIHWALLSLAIL